MYGIYGQSNSPNSPIKMIPDRLRKLPDWDIHSFGRLVRFPWISAQAVVWIDWVQTSTLMASPISSARISLRRLDWHCWNWYLQIFVCIFFSLQRCDVLHYLIHLFRMARYHSVAGEVVSGKGQACAGHCCFCLATRHAIAEMQKASSEDMPMAKWCL